MSFTSNPPKQEISDSDKISIPVQTVKASVKNMQKRKKILRNIENLRLEIKNSFFWCLLRQFCRKGIIVLGCILFVFLTLECVFWVWIFQMPKEKFYQFTSCLDAGVVPSLKERFIYHIACFWGSIGG